MGKEEIFQKASSMQDFLRMIHTYVGSEKTPYDEQETMECYEAFKTYVKTILKLDYDLFVDLFNRRIIDVKGWEKVYLYTRMLEYEAWKKPKRKITIDLDKVIAFVLTDCNPNTRLDGIHLSNLNAKNFNIEHKNGLILININTGS